MFLQIEGQDKSKEKFLPFSLHAENITIVVNMDYG